MVIKNWYSFERRLRIINYSWQNQHWHEILFNRAGADPTKVPTYWKSKFPCRMSFLIF